MVDLLNLKLLIRDINFKMYLAVTKLVCILVDKLVRNIYEILFIRGKKSRHIYSVHQHLFGFVSPTCTLYKGTQIFIHLYSIYSSMESLTRGLRFRKSALKPIQITKRSATSTIRNQDGNDVTEIDGTDDYSYLISNGEEQPLSPAARLFHEPNFNVYVIAIIGSKNPINTAIVYEKLPQTLLKHPRFSSLQVISVLIGYIGLVSFFLPYIEKYPCIYTGY